MKLAFLPLFFSLTISYFVVERMSIEMKKNRKTRNNITKWFLLVSLSKKR
jgi:hypothetical protein